MDLVARHAQLLPHYRGRPAQRAAVAQQGEGHAVRHVFFGELALWVGLVGVTFVDEVQEAQASALVVVKHDVAVVGRHQRAHHQVDATQHLRHLQGGAGQVGNLVKGLLQAL